MRPLLCLALILSAFVLLGTSPPPTPVEPVKEVLHGVTIEDPYRWLEGSDAPEIEGEDAVLEQRVSDWTDAQNAYTRDFLDTLPHRAKVEARLRELMEVGVVGSPRMRGTRYFYSKREGDQNQAVLYMREEAFGEPRVLLDPNTMDEEKGLASLSWFVPSHDGTKLAYGIHWAGDENTILYLMDVGTGDLLSDVIEGKVGEVYWHPDGIGFFYRRLADLDNPYSGQIKYHTVGTDPAEDPILFEQYKEGPLATTWGPYAYVSRDARWLILTYYTGTDSNDLFVVDLERWFEDGTFEPVTIVEGERAQSEGFVVDNTLYMTTTLDAPNQRVMAVDLNDPDPAGWKTILPEHETAVLTDLDWAEGILAADYLTAAHTRMELYDMDGKSLGELELPGIGSAGIRTEPDRTEAFLTYTSFNEPRTIYRMDLETGDRKIWERPDVPVDPDLVTVEQVWYPSKDGTKISMFLVYKKGLEKNGNNPTLLNGYGGFNISRTPFFSATLFPWFESGGIYALPNLRGGGEYGEAWHRAGMLDQKQNVFDDFIAAAEWLIENDYTNSDRLGITGGSNGGLLTGAALTQRPDLFSAVISAVPLLDMLRYQHFLMARYWVPEYGTSENPDHVEFLRAYSPYHQIKKGTPYPAVLFTAGENDARVHPSHARKVAAWIQAATTSDSEKEPVLLWVEREAGHGAGKPLDMRVRDVADQRMFMMWQLGMLDELPPAGP
jgi:prolyl oligopeptidase